MRKNFVIKNIVILISLLFSFNSYSQKIDSINVLSQNTPPEIHVFGKLYHTGYSITDVNYEVSDSIFLTIFFKECNGYQVVAPFDTVLSVTESWPVVPNEIIIISILDTNTTDANCIIVNQYDTLEINTFSTSTLNIDNFVQLEKIKIFPNPASNILKIENISDFKNKKVSVYNVFGAKIREHIITDDGLIDVSDLNSGIYFIKIIANNNILLTQKFIKL